MTKQLTLKLQHFSEVMPKDVAALRSDAAALAKFLESPNVSRTGLGVYWHVVPYLMEGIATTSPTAGSSRAARSLARTPQETSAT